MNPNFEIIKLTWQRKSNKEEIVSFFIVNKINHEYFFNNPAEITRSVKALEIYAIPKNEYLLDSLMHNQRVIDFSNSISSRFTSGSLSMPEATPEYEAESPNSPTAIPAVNNTSNITPPRLKRVHSDASLNSSPKASPKNTKRIAFRHT